MMSIMPAQLRRTALAFAAFFLLLCSYYILRPVRDEMAVQSGVGRLQWLFTATFVLTLVIVPVFGWVVKRVPRARVLPAVYGFLVLNIVAFYLAFRAGITVAGAAAFFVWLSFFVMFAVSIFWSRLADSFTKEEAHRLYGYVAAGGTAGALAGPALTALLARGLGTANLLALSAVLLALATACMIALGRLRSVQDPSLEKPVGGSVLAGIGLAMKVKSLRGIAILVVCYTLVSTFTYVEIVDLAGRTYAGSGERTAFFARLDLAVNGLALAIQLLVTRRVVERFGLATALTLVPAVILASLAALAAWRALAMFAAVQVMHRAGEFAMSKPGREMVYTVVDAESRYKAKNFIDTAVYRAGDAASAWVMTALKGAQLDTLLIAGVPAAIGWLVSSYYVGKRHDRNEPA